jgi:tetratricopeptide (TPR) repeat protein
MIRMKTMSLVLVGAMALAGCPKGGKGPTAVELDEERMNDPAYVFEAGKAALIPDRRGAINYGQAYELFTKSADALNGGPKAHFNAGWVAERLGKSDDAERHYQAAFSADSGYAPAMYSLARVLKSNGKTNEAAEVYAGYLEANPSDAEVRTEYMDALVSADRFADAIAQGQMILRKDPNSDSVYRSLSGLYLKQGKLAMAQIMGDKALELNDADPNVYNNMGVVHLQQHDLPAAIDKFKMARKLDSGHYEANMNLGLIAVNSGDYSLAIDCFDKALERNPVSVDARLGRAVALRGTGELADAGRMYDELIKEDASLDSAYFNAATLHRKYTKDFSKSLKYLEAYKDSRAGELSPSDPVFQLIEEVAAEKAAEEERKRLEAERKRQEEERKRRAREALDKMEAVVIDTQARIETNLECLPEEVSMEVSMILEEVAGVIESEDTEMAAEVQQMLDDYYLPMLDDAIATGCAGGGDTPAEDSAAPADEASEDGEAPADGVEAPADDETAAEETATEE